MLRSLLLYLSEREPLEKFPLRSSVGRRLAARFIAGDELEDAFRAVRRLNAECTEATLDYLRESVRDALKAEAPAGSILRSSTS